MWLNTGYGFGNPWLSMAWAAAPIAAAAAASTAYMPYSPMFMPRASAWSMFAGAGMASLGMMAGYGLSSMLWNTGLYGGYGGMWGLGMGLGYGGWGWGRGLWF